MTLRQISQLPNGPEKAKSYAIEGLLTDGAHHKQWFFEQILISLGVNLTEMREELNKEDYDWEPGIPP